jgi:hypothetical protein
MLLREPIFKILNTNCLFLIYLTILTGEYGCEILFLGDEPGNTDYFFP